MKKLLLFLLLATAAFGQGSASKLRTAPTLPATCSAGSGTVPVDVVVVNHAIYICGPSDNNWTGISGGSSAGLPLNSIQYNSSNALAGSAVLKTNGSMLALGTDASFNTTKTSLAYNDLDGVPEDALFETAVTFHPSVGVSSVGHAVNLTITPTGSWATGQIMSNYTNMELTGTAFNGGAVQGPNTDILVDQFGTLDNVIGTNTQVFVNGPGTVTHELYGGSTFLQVGGAVTSTDTSRGFVGYIVQVSVSNAGASIAQGRGIWIKAPLSRAASFPYNALEIGDANGASDYAIKTGLGQVSFGGVLIPTVGISEPEAAFSLTAAAGKDLLWADSTAHRWKMNNNNGGAVQVVASGVDINTSDQVTATHLASALPSSQGGTGNAFFGVSGPATSTKTYTFQNASSNVPSIVGSSVQGSILVFSDTTGTVLGAVSDVATGQVLVSGGTNTAPSYSATPTLTSVTLASGGNLSLSNKLLITTAPTISTHFNTSGDSIAASNGTGAFKITVGTSTGTSTGVLSLPTATNGWACWLSNQNRAAVIQQTANTTSSATFTNYGTTPGTPVNWTNSDVLVGGCVAF